MRILADKEICRLLDVSSELDYIDYENVNTVSTVDVYPVLKAQQQQDLKDFIWWLEERMWFEDSRTAGIKGSSSKFYDDFQSLKQLVED